MAQRPPTLNDLIASLTALSFPTPTTAFLQPILTPPSSSTSSFRQPPPLAALAATAKHRLLSASIIPSSTTTTTTTPSILTPSTPSLPPNISDVRVKDSLLPHDVFLQVVDILDLGRSKWEQVESLEAERKGETTKGREVIRVVPATAGDENEPSSAGTQFPASVGDKSSRGPFKLLLCDFRGTMIWGFELRKVEKIGLPPLMGIGCKVLLRKGARVARGVVLLEPGNVVVLGGKVDVEDKTWRAGREERLRKEVKEEAEGLGEQDGE